MGKNKIYKYQVRLTKDQYERLKQNARQRGFSFLSSYVRFAALDMDFLMARKITEIHEHIFGEPQQVRSKKKGRPHPEAIWSK